MYGCEKRETTEKQYKRKYGGEEEVRTKIKRNGKEEKEGVVRSTVG